MILRNAHCAMNGNQTSNYFDYMPPAFEHWISQEPRAKAVPENIFNDCIDENTDMYAYDDIE